MGHVSKRQALNDSQFKEQNRTCFQTGFKKSRKVMLNDNYGSTNDIHDQSEEETIVKSPKPK